MNCHDIGRGMNWVVEEVIDLYDEGRINAEAALIIIATAARGVHWCDGISQEATETINGRRCGKCLQSLSEDEDVYFLYPRAVKGWNAEWRAGRRDTPVGFAFVCEDCYRDVMDARPEGEVVEDKDPWHSWCGELADTERIRRFGDYVTWQFESVKERDGGYRF